jgi:DNA-binding CsgD family transcriptional regulator
VFFRNRERAKFAGAAAGRPAPWDVMAEPFRSGDALFAFESDLTVVSWNAAMEQLTGIPAEEAVGRPCWDVLGAREEDGTLVCHPGCSGARLAREGWPVPCRQLHVRTAEGRRKVWLSTIVVRDGVREPVILHLLRNGNVVAANGAGPRLTRRQRQVLELLARGVPVKVVATRLGIAETTARNHVQAILAELRCHSQLEAVARARQLGLLDLS